MTSLQFNNITIEIDSTLKNQEKFNQEIKKSTNSLSVQSFPKINDLSKKNHTKIFKVQITETPKKFLVLHSKSKTSDNSDKISNNVWEESNVLKDNYKINFLNDSNSNNQIQKEKDNELTSPKICEELNKIKSNTILHNEKSSINHVINKRKFCNKFQVYQINKN